MVAGLQEGRAKTKSVQHGVFYTRFCAAADENGSYGSQVWLHNSLQFRPSSWKAVDPRIVYVAGASKKFSKNIRVVSAHAPHEKSLPIIKDAFWDLLRDTVCTLFTPDSDDIQVLSIDANARAGSVPSSFFGPCEPEKENDNGRRFKHFLESTSLYAINTFFEAGPTWISQKGGAFRMDYVCAQLSLRRKVRSCNAPGDAFISIVVYEDHRPVIAGFEGVPHGPAKMQKSIGATTIPYNRSAFWDPAKRRQFEAEMWKFDDRRLPGCDEHLECLNKYIIETATKVFGKAADRPRKPWLAPWTWEHVKRNAPLRRVVAKASKLRLKAYGRVVFVAWASTVSTPFVPTASSNAQQPFSLFRRGGGPQFVNLGWQAAARFSEVRACFVAVCQIQSLVYKTARAHQRATDVLVAIDRQHYIGWVARSAQIASAKGDFRTTFVCVRQLAGSSTQSDKSVRLATGELASTEQQRQERWQEHFCEVFNGSICRRGELPRAIADYSDLARSSTFHTSLEITRQSYAALKSCIGVGTDHIGGELLQAGGSAIACKFDSLHQKIRRRGFPSRWRGGRAIDLWKCKGEQEICDNSRGLLLADHSAKAFVGQLKLYVEPIYNAHMPADQFGATSGRGTDFAHHILQSYLDYCTLAKLCVFILFLDLVKAFDRVVRELVLGWPSHVLPSDRLQYLIGLGVPPAAAEHIKTFIDEHGAAFDQWGVDKLVATLLRDLHEGAWFQYGDLESVVRTAKGGRQGCKVGATIFNSAYTFALDNFKKTLGRHGIFLRVRYPVGAFWGPIRDDLPNDAEVIDVTFVDDECVLLSASNGALLDKAIDLLLSSIASSFAKFALDINWGKGKSECFVKYRGTNATWHYSNHRCNGALVYDVPAIPGCTEARVLHAVDSYTHLGFVTTMSGKLLPDARHKERNAMRAYSPLATRIFENRMFARVEIPTVGAEPKKAAKAEVSDEDIAMREDLARDIAAIPSQSKTIAILQAQFDALPKPREVATDTQAEQPKTPKEVENMVAHLTIARNERMAAYKGRKDAHREQVQGWADRIAELQGYIAQAEAFNVTQGELEGIELTTLNGRITHFENMAEACATKLAYGFHPEAMKPAFMSEFESMERKPLVIADMFMAVSKLLLKSKLGTEIREQEERLKMATRIVCGSTGSADANPKHLQAQADQAFAERHLAAQGGAIQVLPPALAVAAIGPQKADAVASGVRAAISGNLPSDPVDVRCQPKRGAEVQSNPLQEDDADLH